jgi:CHAT domain-containing protein
VAALAANRLSEGRFSGGFQYAPLQDSIHHPLRGKSLMRIYHHFEAELKRRPTREAKASFAILNLALGKTDEALELFTQLASGQPENAESLSDLAAFWLARARISRDPFDLIRALDAADRAVRLNPSLPEAWFNLAVAQELLFLPRAAERAWANYLSFDESSPWSWEARTRLLKDRQPPERELWENERSRLKQAILREEKPAIDTITRRFPLPVRLWVEEELLPQWGEAELSGEESLAAILLKGAGHIAAIQESITGDTLLAESVQAIKNDPSAIRSILARGHVLFGAGRKAYTNERPEEAETLFRQARISFSRGNSPFFLWTDLSIAICRFEDKDFLGTLTQLSALLRSAEPKRYRALTARALWIRGMVQFARGEPTLSLRDFHQASDTLAGTRASEDEGAVHYLIAANLSYLGDFHEAWRHLYKALAATPTTIQERRLFSAFDEAGTALEKAGEVRAALYFRDAVVVLSRVVDRSDPTGLGHAYLRRAESRWKIGDQVDAQADLHRARLLANNIESVNLREGTLAKVDIAEAEVFSANLPESSLSISGRALGYYLRLGSYFDLPRIYRIRCQALLNMGRLREAILELDRGIREYERIRRISYFDQSRQLFEMMMKLQEEAKRPGAALWYAERERSRDLLDVLAAPHAEHREITGTHPLEPQVLVDRLPYGVALVEYALLDDRLLAWVVQHGDISSFSLKIDSFDLAERIRATRDELANRDRDGHLTLNLEYLYDLIVRPLEPALQGARSIVFVPDGPLSGLPFAALRDRFEGQYLVESRVVSVSPSASFYAVAGAAAEGQLSANPSVLAIGASSFDRIAFDRLPSLKQVEREAKEVASLYGQSTLLPGPRATIERFMSEVGKHEVVHFSGHAITIADLPMSSLMIFAPSRSGDSGALSAAHLYQMNLAKTRVVVLSACSTGLGAESSLEISSGLVQPFLARGVSAVAASLWEVDDEQSIDLSVAFHRHLLEHRSASAALRAAQLDLIRSVNKDLSSPSTWAVLQVFEAAPKGERGKIPSQLQYWPNQERGD